jgi:hypothetical protein
MLIYHVMTSEKPPTLPTLPMPTCPPSFTNDDLETAKEIYKPLMPQGDNALDKTLVQGGAVRIVQAWG